MQIQYQGPRMRGAQNTFQEWSITPMSSNQYWMPNQVIKLMGNISQGLVDPYRSHIQFTVQVTNQLLPVGLLQIDSSAQSLISQTVVQSNQNQLQRIQQYDVLACILTDIGFSQYVCLSRSGQGLGFSNVPSYNPTGVYSTPVQQATHMAIPPLPQNSYPSQRAMQGSLSPVMAPQVSGAGYLQAVTDVPGGTTSQLKSGMPNTYQSLNNWISFPYGGADIYTASTGRALGVRTQNLLGPLSCGYPDSPSTFPCTTPFVKNQDWVYSNMLSKGYSPQRPYQTTYLQRPPNMGDWYALPPSNCGKVGYTKPYSAQFSTGCNQPYISACVPQCQMVEGKLLPEPIPITRKRFRMPLISGILGILIPPDQFQLIPAQSLKNFILQLTLNPYAFFTSGYSDVHELDSYGMQVNNMQKRNWRITSFQWIWHLYTFRSPEILGSIKQKLVKGIDISSNYWQLASQYQLPNGSYARNSWQIPTNVQSLAQVIVAFIDNSYQTKTFCRKNFRLSNNITSMQFKANGAYYPLQPIMGNAGNPQMYGTSGDNWNFYETLLLSNNFLFSTNSPTPKINTKNFAINSRCYDINNVNTYLNPKDYNTNQGDWGAVMNTVENMSINADTAMGQSWFHQNRYRGTAVFCYTFQPYGHSKQYINGLNTVGYRQFDVIFNNSPINVFPYDQTLLIFTRSNIVVRYGQNGIGILGV